MQIREHDSFTCLTTSWGPWQKLVVPPSSFVAADGPKRARRGITLPKNFCFLFSSRTSRLIAGPRWDLAGITRKARSERSRYQFSASHLQERNVRTREEQNGKQRIRKGGEELRIERGKKERKRKGDRLVKRNFVHEDKKGEGIIRRALSFRECRKISNARRNAPSLASLTVSVLFTATRRNGRETACTSSSRASELTNGKDLSGATAGLRVFFIGGKRAAVAAFAALSNCIPTGFVRPKAKCERAEER